MLRRAVKNGYVAKYFLFDKWFFGEDFIKKVRSIKDGAAQGRVERGSFTLTLSQNRA